MEGPLHLPHDPCAATVPLTPSGGVGVKGGQAVAERRSREREAQVPWVWALKSWTGFSLLSV